MKQFNYKKAWQQIAFPGWEALPQNVRDLVFKVSCALNYGQMANLDMEWPDKRVDRGESITLPEDCAKQIITGKKCSDDITHEMFHLRERFDKIESIWLAKAARIVHNYGHWAPGVRQQPLLEDAPWNVRYAEATVLQRTGGHWKFANLCDQVLCERIGLVRVTKDPHGVSHKVIAGTIRACLNYGGGWTWEELGWATPDNWEKLAQVGRPRPRPTTPWQRMMWTEGLDREWKVYLSRAKKVISTSDFIEVSDIGPFMEEDLPRGAL